MLNVVLNGHYQHASVHILFSKYAENQVTEGWHVLIYKTLPRTTASECFKF